MATHTFQINGAYDFNVIRCPECGYVGCRCLPEGPDAFLPDASDRATVLEAEAVRLAMYLRRNPAEDPR